MQEKNYTYAINDSGCIYVGEGKTQEEAKFAAEKAKEAVLLNDEFGFDCAIQVLKAGEKVARKGWNGKGMYLFLVNGKSITEQINDVYGDPSRHEVSNTGQEAGRTLPVLDAIYMKTADDKLVPWLASQTDVLAEDWQIVE